MYVCVRACVRACVCEFYKTSPGHISFSVIRFILMHTNLLLVSPLNHLNQRGMSSSFYSFLICEYIVRYSSLSDDLLVNVP